MLSEIYCEKFHKKRIRFNKGLSVVLGTDTGSNSIGKSTLMLIIDFAFGGNTYCSSLDIIEKVGSHEIGFMFQFGNQEFFFSRSITDRNYVWKCAAEYNHVEKISNEEFCEWLRRQYAIDLYKLTFRDAVGRFIRVYRKENCNEKYPLNVVPGEPRGKAAIALLKLFGLYEPIESAEKNAHEAAETYKLLTRAQARELIAAIDNKQYQSNKKTIKELSMSIDRLSEDLDRGILDGDAIVSERAIHLKQELSHARRMYNRVSNRISQLTDNAVYPFSLTTDSFSELQRFFPSINLKHLEEIERFHERVSQLFRGEIEDEISALKKQLAELSETVGNLEQELKDLIRNPNISKQFLEKHAEVVAQIVQLKRENESYEKLCNIRNTKRESTEELRDSKNAQFSILEKKMNTEMDRINSCIYQNGTNAPILHFTGNTYSFITPYDTGTGMAYKGLVVYDLAVANLTSIPILVHDSDVLKLISDEAIERIIQQYNDCNKQVIIALDKQNSYSEKTSSMLEKHAVIHLSPGGGELFGWAWGRK